MPLVNNSAASYVLASLRQTNNDLSVSQTRIGTGKRVNSSSDDAAAWSRAQTIRSDMKAQENLATGIAAARGKADTASKAIDSVIKLAGKIKEVADGIVSNDPGAGNYGTANNKIAALKTQIASVMAGAKFAGENWLTDPISGTVGGVTYTATRSVNISINSGAASAINLTVLDLDQVADTPNGIAAGDYTTFAAIATISNAGASGTNSAGAVSTGVDTLVGALTAYQGTLSTFSDALGVQQDYQTALKNVREATLSSLVDADLTQENAKITALQTQQQLSYQALSIGNSSASSILRLFQ